MTSFKTEPVSFRSSGKASSEANQRLKSSTISAPWKSSNYSVRRTGKEYNDDILSSNSTETTKGSPDFPELFLPAGVMADDLYKQELSLRTGHNDGGTTPLLSLAQPRTWFSNHNHSKSQQHSGKIAQDLLHSLPPASGLSQPTGGSGGLRTTRSRAIPVSRPSRGGMFRPRSKQLDLEDPTYYTEEEEDDHLQHVFDLKTWNMYRLITDARAARAERSKKSQQRAPVEQRQQEYPNQQMQNMVPCASIPQEMLPSEHEANYGHFAFGDETEVPSIPLEVGGPSSVGNDMIFDLE